MYNQIEKNLLDFLEYVPLDIEHLNVYSLKLVTSLLEIGPEIINAFDLAIFSSGSKSVNEMFDDEPLEKRLQLIEEERSLRESNRSLTFKKYYSYLNSYFFAKISRATIRLQELDAYIQPFENSIPNWWESYNLLKHDKYDNLKKATLQNVLQASSALFWLADLNSRLLRINDNTNISKLFVKIEPYDRNLASLKKIEESD